MIRLRHMIISVLIHAVGLGLLMSYCPSPAGSTDPEKSEAIEKKTPIKKTSQPAPIKVALKLPSETTPPSQTPQSTEPISKPSPPEPLPQQEPPQQKAAQQNPPKDAAAMAEKLVAAPLPPKTSMQPDMMPPNLMPPDSSELGNIEYQAQIGSVQATLADASPSGPRSHSVSTPPQYIVSRPSDRGVATSSTNRGSMPSSLEASSLEASSLEASSLEALATGGMQGNASFENKSGMIAPGFLVEALNDQAIQSLIDRGDLLLVAGNGERNYRFSGSLYHPTRVRVDGSLVGYSSRSLTPNARVVDIARATLAREFSMTDEEKQQFQIWLLLSQRLDRVILEGQRSASREAKLPLADLAVTSGRLQSDAQGRMSYVVTDWRARTATRQSSRQ
ncbi:hypothetical protein [Stieleria varia]|uniref:Uncharacterized protein n=1 Tax=Stieleria varia TaxID=2528005 RepID=A0A5C6B842_9BACT|nr:hypothetical protein [Stieleria varia]TWU07601.1 hypothetical protein Pla52n_01740 [Stieleria varia]